MGDQKLEYFNPGPPKSLKGDIAISVVIVVFGLVAASDGAWWVWYYYHGGERAMRFLFIALVQEVLAFAEFWILWRVMRRIMRQRTGG